MPNEIGSHVEVVDNGGNVEIPLLQQEWVLKQVSDILESGVLDNAVERQIGQIALFEKHTKIPEWLARIFVGFAEISGNWETILEYTNISPDTILVNFPRNHEAESIEFDGEKYFHTLYLERPDIEAMLYDMKFSSEQYGVDETVLKEALFKNVLGLKKGKYLLQDNHTYPYNDSYGSKGLYAFDTTSFEISTVKAPRRKK